jgi:hypothetical protein
VFRLKRMYWFTKTQTLKKHFILEIAIFNFTVDGFFTKLNNWYTQIYDLIKLGRNIDDFLEKTPHTFYRGAIWRLNQHNIHCRQACVFHSVFIHWQAFGFPFLPHLIYFTFEAVRKNNNILRRKWLAFISIQMELKNIIYVCLKFFK